jgi:hypothetical protein
VAAAGITKDVESEPSLDEVRELAEQLRRETRSWYRELEGRGVDTIKLGRVATLVGAVTSTTQLLVDVLDGFHDDMQRIVAPDGDWQESITRNFEGRSNTNYVSVGLKAWLFDIRALQDALGTLLSAIVGTATECPWRSGSTKAIRSPTRSMLRCPVTAIGSPRSVTSARC